MALEKVGYFTGKKFWEKFDAARAEYPGNDAQLNVYRDGMKILVAVCETGGDGDPINESHPCPGSPGC